MRKHNWTKTSTEQIISGKSTDGVLLLELFLQDYIKLFSEKPNAGCRKCIAQYHKNYILKLHQMDSKCEYVLQKRYLGIPLELSGKDSSVSLNNENITNARAKQLIRRLSKQSKDFKPGLIFTSFPEPVVRTKKPKKAK
jgi:hypothetical protein